MNLKKRLFLVLLVVSFPACQRAPVSLYEVVRAKVSVNDPHILNRSEGASSLDERTLNPSDVLRVVVEPETASVKDFVISRAKIQDIDAGFEISGISAEGDSLQMARVGAVTYGTIRTREANSRSYEFRKIGTQVVFDKLNETVMGGCETTDLQIKQNNHAQNSEDSGSGIAQDAQTAHPRVLVLFTPLALENEMGGIDGMRAKAMVSIAQTNEAYSNSGINAVVQYVGAALVNYAESGSFATDLNRLTHPTDGYMDMTYRKRANADLVTLLIHAGGGQNGTCGIGWVNTNFAPNSNAWAWAFSVVKSACIPNDSVAHELGHNMGAMHDRENSTGTGAFSYSYGYRNPTLTWRTIMAYAPGVRIRYFSNPLVNFMGEPTGIDETQVNSADNAKTLNLTLPAVETFRTFL